MLSFFNFLIITASAQPWWISMQARLNPTQPFCGVCSAVWIYSAYGKSFSQVSRFCGFFDKKWTRSVTHRFSLSPNHQQPPSFGPHWMDHSSSNLLQPSFPSLSIAVFIFSNTGGMDGSACWSLWTGILPFSPSHLLVSFCFLWVREVSRGPLMYTKKEKGPS